MTKIKKGDYIFIKWVDSAGGTGWIDASQSDITGFSTINSVGIVFKITKDCITIVQSQTVDTDDIDNYINIPTVAICEKKLLNY